MFCWRLNLHCTKLHAYQFWRIKHCMTNSIYQIYDNSAIITIWIKIDENRWLSISYKTKHSTGKDFFFLGLIVLLKSCFCNFYLTIFEVWFVGEKILMFMCFTNPIVRQLSSTIEVFFILTLWKLVLNLWFFLLEIQDFIFRKDLKYY